MNSIKRATLSSTILAGLFVSAFATPAFAATTPAVSEESSVGEIVVTARKREEDILKTPVAVSALTSEDIAKRGIVSVNDIAQNTPGINISNISSGRNDRSFQQISLRGFTPSTSTSIYTASFIDGVPVASATALQTVTDPERVEILKGPQAAYFGRNTFAGAINVVNKEPKNDLGGSIEATIGTRNLYDVIGSIEGGLVPDKLLVRVTGRAYSKDGSYTNQSNGRKLGSQRTDTATALIVAKPLESLTVKGFGIYSVNNDGPSAQGMLSAYEVRSNNGAENEAGVGTVIVPSVANCTLSGFTAGRSATEARVSRPFICGAAPRLVAGFSPAQNTNENALLRNFLADGTYRVVSPGQGVKGYGLKSQYYHLHLNIDYEVGDTGVTLSSLTGYNHEYYSELADLDNYDSSLLTNAAYNAATKTVLPYWDFPFLVERKTEDFSQEFRASYDNGGPLQGTIGVNYLLTKASSDLVSGNTALVAGAARPASSLSPPQKARTLSGFFGVTYAITDQFKLSAEGRYQEDKIYAYTGGSAAGLVISANNNYGLPAGTFAPLSVFYTKKFKNFLPRVIGQFQATPDIMAYASWSKGVNVSLASFNTAFLNGSATVVSAAQALGLQVVVNPEKLDNYEVGIKGKFFDGRLRASLAGYYAIWNNQTNNRSVVIQDAAPPAGTGVAQIVSGLANSGKAIVKGIELDSSLRLIEGLDINLAASLNDSSIRTFTDPSISKLSGVIDSGFRGNQLPSSSKYSANLGAQYGLPIAGWDGAWFIRGDLSYKSKQYADAANLTWIKARTVANFRVGISKGGASLELFVNNAFNDKNYISVANNSVLTPSFALTAANSYLNVGLPDLRTYGLKASYKF